MSVSPSTYHKGLQKKVDELVRRYDRIKEPRPVIRDVLRRSDESSLLVDALGRQVSLIRCRSQAFDDGQITVYDKALLVLTQDGQDPFDTGALELYLTEFLGLVPICGALNTEDAVAKHVELQNALNRVSEAYSMTGTTTTTTTTATIAPPDNHIPYHREYPNPREHHNHHHDEGRSNPRSNARSDDNQHLHERVGRMLNIYYQAKDDYIRTKRREGVDSLSAIRFLRDTAENTLLYLRANGLVDHGLVPELEYTFRSSRDKAAELSGGRKRHFDDDRDRRVEKRVEKRGRVIDSYRP